MAKLILYTSLSLVCISNRNQRCLRKNFLHNGFSDYLLFCTKRGPFIHEQRSDRSRPITRTFKKRKKECTLYEYLKKKKIPQKTLMSRNACNGENGEKSPAAGDLNWMPKVAPWRLAILVKMVILAKLAILAKIARGLAICGKIFKLDAKSGPFKVDN